MRWTREALRTRLRHLSEQHSGRDLVNAVVAFADTLEEEDRKLLQSVLLERGNERHYDWNVAFRRRRRFLG
jgi:hypothetical protein